MKILVVDDNQDAAESVLDLLNLEGHDVRIAADGHAALKMYQEDTYHLVLMDLKMPRMDGIQATREILLLDPEARIVILTGNTVQEDLSAVESLPIAGLLRKPFDAAELLAFAAS